MNDKKAIKKLLEFKQLQVRQVKEVTGGVMKATVGHCQTSNGSISRDSTTGNGNIG